MKLLLEAGPLVVFFAVNSLTGDLITATGIFVIVTMVALVASWMIFRKLPVMPLVGGFFVLLFGGLTYFLEDELFIKIKPTIVNLLFASILAVGLVTGRNFLKLALESALALDDAGWRILTVRWAIFFCFLALLNEIVWRNWDSDTWVAFKVWGIMPLTLVFSLSQLPLILKHQVPTPEEQAKADAEADAKAKAGAQPEADANKIGDQP